MDHRDSSASQVSQVIRQIGIETLNQPVVRKARILPEWRFAQQVVAQRVVAGRAE